MRDARRAWKRIAIACAISFAIHVLIAAFAHGIPASEASARDTPFVVTEDAQPTPEPTPVRTPPPIVKHTPPPYRMLTAPVQRLPQASRPLAHAHRSITAPHVVAIASGAPIENGPTGPNDPIAGAGVPDGTSTVGPSIEPAGPAVPLATAPAVPACAQPNVDAHTRSVVEPDVDTDDAAQGAGSEAQIRVDLSDTGAVLAAIVARSTGNPRLDEAARLAALHSTYAPEIADCKPRAGSYLFRVDFTG
jgi:periplasmic protein TonB